MQVLTSLSGLPVSAASAGFAPTNSADVSAIASAYRVVSATATQLYAGSSYVTSVNDAPLSASRAGNAANASLANSAWYDGTGRLISALPDSAAVSAIASAYAESAASGKQDELTFSYDDDKISAINGSALAGQGGGGLITSIQSSQDPWYQTSISGLNGSALYSRWAESANSASQASIASKATSASYAASAPTAWASSFITGVVSPSGTIRVLDGTAIEGTNSAMLPSTVIPGFESASSINADSWSPGTSIGPGVSVTGTIPSENPYTNLVLKMGWGELTVSVTGDNGETASVSKLGPDEYVTAQLPNATSYTLTTDGWVTLYAITASATTHEIGGGVGELAWASALPTYSYDAEDKISAINGSALAGGGGVDSATVSAIASSYAESAVSGKADSSALSSYVPYSSLEYNTASAISGINGSALAAGSTYSAGEGIDITDDVISVETPVDIVAGPGIVIDNPDGNTLRVSLSNSIETVLWDGPSVWVSASPTIELSESISSFERIGIYAGGYADTNQQDFKMLRLSAEDTANGAPLNIQGVAGNGTYVRFNVGLVFPSANGSALSFQNFNQFNLGTSVNKAVSPSKIQRVVGINRTASAQ